MVGLGSGSSSLNSRSASEGEMGDLESRSASLDSILAAEDEAAGLSSGSDLEDEMGSTGPGSALEDDMADLESGSSSGNLRFVLEDGRADLSFDSASEDEMSGLHSRSSLEDEAAGPRIGSAREDDPQDEYNFKGQLLQCLKKINCTGSFATSGAFSAAANPGLNIEGFGAVGLPILSRDAQSIIETCHPAPFGKGSETVVDTNVRKTWELNPDKFRLENPAWEKSLHEMLIRVKEDLGLQGDVTAMLHKMLLYEKDAMFKPHKEYASNTDPRNRWTDSCFLARRRPLECSVHWWFACPLNTKVGRYT